MAAWTDRRQNRLRRGITLLEVLISVAVLSLGLLGLASLIPIGKYQMAEAAKMDRASGIGRAAFRTLVVSQWMRPDMWLYGTNANVGQPVVYQGRFMPPPVGTGVRQSPPQVPLVLDPLMVASNTPPAQNASSLGLRLVQTFPYGVGTSTNGGPEASAPVIPRITLRNVPGPYTSGGSLMPMALGGADRLFRGTDDLVYTNLNLNTGVLVENNTAQAFLSSGNVPVMNYIPTTINAYSVPASNGDYSWLVAIQPDVSQVWGGVTQSGLFYNGGAGMARQFAVSVVAFQKRPLLPVVAGSAGAGLINTMQDNTRGERMVWVDFIGRGSARLRTSNQMITGQSDAQQYLAVRTNQWIAVTGRRTSTLPNPTNPSNPNSPWLETSLHWFQIVASSNVPQKQNNQWFIDVILVGDDWTQSGYMSQQMYLYNDENSFSYSDYPDPPTAYGTILTGAVGVYTKTITLDGSSRWSDY